MPKALITCHHLQRHFAAFRPQYEMMGVEPILPRIAGQQLDAAGMREVIKGVDAVIAGDDIIDASVLQVAKDSGITAVIKWGIGTDGIDKVSATKLGIPVYNTPGVFANEVADLAMSLLLNITRGTHHMHRSIEDGGWLKVEGRTLAGMTAGVIGLGSIGQAIAKRAAAFGMNVIGCDVAEIPKAALLSSGCRQVPLEDVLRQSDVLLLACNLTPENRHLINEGAFKLMKHGVFVVNVSRGQLIDEVALVAALAGGKVEGAGLDVFEVEPLPASSPLRKFDNCVFATHNGSNTREAVHRINQMTTDILFHVLGLKADLAFTPNRVA